MFKLDPNPTFFEPVEIHVPGQGIGTFEVEFRYLDNPERKEFADSLKKKTNLQALSEIVVGWREIDTPFSHANLEKLLNKYNAAGPLFVSFSKGLHGAPEKN